MNKKYPVCKKYPIERKDMIDFLRTGTLKSWMYYSKKRWAMCDRVIVWFSCGAASAVAAKIAIQNYKGVLPVHIFYCDTGSEHPDNERFLKECEEWFGQEIEILKNEKYDDIWDVFEKERYLVGPSGAKCTTVLKKALRNQVQRADSDIQVFGYDIDEYQRADDFRKRNFEICLEATLIDSGLSKQDCLGILAKSGIEIPTMYKLGYRNNNCIGCPKGGMGYWNKIRKDFPEVFSRMAEVERKLNISVNRIRRNGEVTRAFLDELDPNAGRYEAEPDISCGLTCGAVYEEIIEDCES